MIPIQYPLASQVERQHFENKGQAFRSKGFPCRAPRKPARCKSICAPSIGSCERMLVGVRTTINKFDGSPSTISIPSQNPTGHQKDHLYVKLRVSHQEEDNFIFKPHGSFSNC